MKKYSILLAIVALVLASLACQTIMGGGDNGFEAPDVPQQTDGDDVEVPSVEQDGGDITVGGESPFPVTSDAFNVISTPQSVTYQTNMSGDDVMKFYRDELGKQGYTEDTSMTTNFSGMIAMFFVNNGKTIVIGGAPVGDGSTSVTVAYQQ
ncbi:MAG TPA: hypothetical protein PKE35_09965 [Anaerolineales bacterium]|nr:hypothetical protein [Anaerolineales bacterium]HMV97395.1 hypothetical protein [Anaerolineales bacterium]HMX18581.1 hypothetical protein [Anaerolineales bacterium]HMX74571.1 hypothetical protein [Anaerolineales bacterium]HMZ41485.1 hypothetical protein [Anaerolineales bacterium]